MKKDKADVASRGWLESLKNPKTYKVTIFVSGHAGVNNNEQLYLYPDWLFQDKAYDVVCPLLPNKTIFVICES